jgi:mannose-6-phosphate isomerase-like protein (cupin superfamily)
MRGTVIEPTGGELAKHDGWEAAVKIDGSVTNGSFALVETRHDPGSGASPHVHRREGETFFVLEGQFAFQLGDERVSVETGGVVFGPPGVVHGFEPGPGGGRLLHIFAPAGIEGFFTRPRDASPDSGERLRREYAVESVGD